MSEKPKIDINFVETYLRDKEYIREQVQGSLAHLNSSNLFVNVNYYVISPYKIDLNENDQGIPIIKIKMFSFSIPKKEDTNQLILLHKFTTLIGTFYSLRDSYIAKKDDSLDLMFEKTIESTATIDSMINHVIKFDNFIHSDRYRKFITKPTKKFNKKITSLIDMIECNLYL